MSRGGGRRRGQIDGTVGNEKFTPLGAPLIATKRYFGFLRNKIQAVSATAFAAHKSHIPPENVGASYYLKQFLPHTHTHV